MGVLRLTRNTLGIVSVLILVAVIVVPELFRFGTLGPDVGEIGIVKFVSIAAGVVALSVVGSVLNSTASSDNSGSTALVTNPPETVHGRATPQAGEELEAAYREYIEAPDEQAEASFRETVKGITIEYYQVAHSCDRETAETAVRTGTWTDDHRAAAFVGTEAESIPLYLRLWDYIRPGNPLRHRVEHTLQSLEAIEETVAPAGRETSDINISTKSSGGGESA